MAQRYMSSTVLPWYNMRTGMKNVASAARGCHVRYERPEGAGACSRPERRGPVYSVDGFLPTPNLSGCQSHLGGVQRGILPVNDDSCIRHGGHLGERDTREGSLVDEYDLTRHEDARVEFSPLISISEPADGENKRGK